MYKNTEYFKETNNYIFKMDLSLNGVRTNNTCGKTIWPTNYDHTIFSVSPEMWNYYYT